MQLATHAIASDLGAPRHEMNTAFVSLRLEVANPSRNGNSAELEQLFSAFKPISLEDTNKSSQMLTRHDNKYILDKGQLRRFLATLEPDFAILEIKDTRVFRYSSCYYDNAFRCYHDHHQGKRLRFKVRTRHYVDSGGIFFEVKLKDHRGRTKKDRITTDVFCSDTLIPQWTEMLYRFFKDSYKRDFQLDLRPSIFVSNKRATLVSLRGGERMTIDFDLKFADVAGNTTEIGDGFIIVETKSGNGRGVSDQVLKEQRIRKASKCSKYCMGAILVGDVQPFNNFRPTLKRVQQNIEKPANSDFKPNGC